MHAPRYFVDHSAAEASVSEHLAAVLPAATHAPVGYSEGSSFVGVLVER